MSRKRIQRGHIHIVWPSGSSVKLSVDERRDGCTAETLARFVATCDATSKVIAERFIAACNGIPGVHSGARRTTDVPESEIPATSEVRRDDTKIDTEGN